MEKMDRLDQFNRREISGEGGIQTTLTGMAQQQVGKRLKGVVDDKRRTPKTSRTEKGRTGNSSSSNAPQARHMASSLDAYPQCGQMVVQSVSADMGLSLGEVYSSINFGY
jgi:hypothetical protein